MAYARFSDTSDWYIYWADGDASSPEQEQLELLRSGGSREPVRLSFRAAEEAVSTGVLPDALPGIGRSDERVILTALREFVSDVRAHYAADGELPTAPDADLLAEAQRASDMLRGKLVGVVRRPRKGELVVELTDGTRLLVHIAGDRLELSIE